MIFKRVVIVLLLLGSIFIFSTAVYAADSTKSYSNPAMTTEKATSGLQDSAWPKWGYNAQNSGLSPYSGPSTCELKWKYETGNDVEISNPSIDKNGNIYIGTGGPLGSNDGYLFALTSSGELKWKYQIEGTGTSAAIVSSPAIDQYGNIYFGTINGYLYALTSDGKLKWRYKTGGMIYSSPNIAKDGTVYFGCYDSYFYALTPEGKLKWRYEVGVGVSPTPTAVYSSPAIDPEGNIYFGCFDHYVYALTSAGELKWRYETGYDVLSSPAIDKYGNIYIGGRDTYLYAFTPSGELEWKYKAGSSIGSSPALDKNGNIYFMCYDGCLYALNPSGKPKWKPIQISTSDHCYSSPIVASNGLIYVGSDDKYMYAFTTEGKLKWKYETTNEIISRPTIDRSGTIYFVNSSYIYAIKGLIVTAKPKGGTYYNSVTIKLETNMPATIFYRIISYNTKTSWIQYNSPIIIKKSFKLEFYAVDPSGNSTPISTELYIIKNNHNKSNTGTVPMQNTGSPLVVAVLGLISVIGGAIYGQLR